LASARFVSPISLDYLRLTGLFWVSWDLLKGKVEGGALVDGRPLPKCPAVPVKDTLDGCQPYAGAGKFRSLVQALEHSE